LPGRSTRTLSSSEKVGLPLDLVDDDQTGKSFEGLHGNRQSAAVDGIFEIKERAWLAVGDHPGKRRLATLSRPQEGRNRMVRVRSGDTLERAWTGNHEEIIFLKIRMSTSGFSCIRYKNHGLAEMEKKVLEA